MTGAVSPAFSAPPLRAAGFWGLDGGGKRGRMPGWVNVILIVAIGAVALVLFGGFANMIGGGSAERSQKLMRWRVGLQFLALAAIVLILLLRR